MITDFIMREFASKIVFILLFPVVIVVALVFTVHDVLNRAEIPGDE